MVWLISHKGKKNVFSSARIKSVAAVLLFYTKWQLHKWRGKLNNQNKNVFGRARGQAEKRGRRAAMPRAISRGVNVGKAEIHEGAAKRHLGFEKAHSFIEFSAFRQSAQAIFSVKGLVLCPVKGQEKKLMPWVFCFSGYRFHFDIVRQTHHKCSLL